MKRLLAMLLALALTLGTVSAMAAAPSNAIEIDATKDRGIQLQPAGLNDTPDGVSPTTGLTLADYDVPSGFAGLAVTGRYMPMLMQVDNSSGGVDEMAPWGASYADIVYETPLHKSGMTRISFLFSDLIPDSAGPVRSARMGHAWLREEWDAGFLFYGQQEYAATNVPEEFDRLGASKKGILFSGTVGKNHPWKQYYNRRKGIPSPHNVDANVAAIYELIDAGFTAPNHAFRFTDELPDGDIADEIRIKTGAKQYGTNLRYDLDSNQYFRYMRYDNDDLRLYVDRDTQEAVTFSNVIIQFCETQWMQADAPVSKLVDASQVKVQGYKDGGEGNADYFMGGVHIAGYWKRDSMTDRTVFYGPDGNEIELQRGKTLIVVIDPQLAVTNKSGKVTGHENTVSYWAK